jgi:hypothetical protein
MDLYRIEDRDGSGHAYTIEARRDGHLGGIVCDVCGRTWAALHEVIPSLDVESHPMRDELRAPRPRPTTEFRRLQASVRAHAPEWAALRPGAALGTLRGEVRGKIRDFMMDTFGRVVLLSPLLQQMLLAQGVVLPRLIPVDITHVSKNPRDLTGFAELEIPPLLQWDESSFVPVPGSGECAACGYRQRAQQGFIVAADARMPDGVSMCRMRNAVSTIVATEACRSAMVACGVDAKVFWPVRQIG